MKLLFLLLLTTIQLFSQKESGYVKYQVYVKANDYNSKDKIKSDIDEGIDEINNEKWSFSLYFNEKQALFKKNFEFYPHVSEQLMYVGLAGEYVKLYYDREAKKTYHPVDYTTKFFLKKNNIVVLDDIMWELKNETKIIEGVICYKATAKFNFGFEDERRNYMIAWYNPDISLNIGPHRTNGLPGLVYELDTYMFNYTLQQIKFEKVDFEQLDLSKYEIISESERKKREKGSNDDILNEIKRDKK